MENKLIILIGISCSGKSTWAKEYVKNNPRSFRVSRDDERTSLFGSYRQGSLKEEEVITNIVTEKTTSLLSKGFTVVLDNTHLRASYIAEAVDAYNYLADIEFKVFDCPSVEEVIKRNQNRYNETGIIIPSDVIAKQRKDFEGLMLETGESYFSQVIPRTNKRVPAFVETGLPKCVIVDLDGTLALLDRSPFTPTEGEILMDTPNVPVVFMVNTILKSGNVEIIFMSGRTDNFREVTEKWLGMWLIGLSDDFKLYMRRDGDSRPDRAIKKALLDQHINGKYQVVAAVDDRHSIVTLWQQLGIFTFDVSQGKGRF